MWCRGVRGAITVEENSARAILTATLRLLDQIVDENGIDPNEIAAVVFTTTPDLDAAYPAQAAREMGWTTVPLLCTQEMAVPKSLPRCIRVLILWNTERTRDRITHVYLGEAARLRPDLAGREER